MVVSHYVILALSTGSVALKIWTGGSKGAGILRRSELSNNSAERKAKSYAIGRKNSLFHTSVDGAVASSIIYSLVETAKANNLNVFQYIYTLLLYMPGCKNRSEGIEQLLPWSDFIKEHCSGLIDVETVTVEEHPQLLL